MKKLRLKNLFGMSFFIIVLLFGSYLFFSDSYIAEGSLNHFKGKISSFGVTNHTIPVGKGTRTSKVLFIKIEGLNETLAHYNIKQEYSELGDKLSVGDSVKVIFRSSTEEYELNTSLYQLEYKGEVLLSQSTYRNKMLIQSIVCIIGALLILGIGLKRDKRFRD